MRSQMVLILVLLILGQFTQSTAVAQVLKTKLVREGETLVETLGRDGYVLLKDLLQAKRAGKPLIPVLERRKVNPSVYSELLGASEIELAGWLRVASARKVKVMGEASIKELSEEFQYERLDELKDRFCLYLEHAEDINFQIDWILSSHESALKRRTKELGDQLAKEGRKPDPDHYKGAVTLFCKIHIE